MNFSDAKYKVSFILEDFDSGSPKIRLLSRSHFYVLERRMKIHINSEEVSNHISHSSTRNITVIYASEPLVFLHR